MLKIPQLTNVDFSRIKRRFLKHYYLIRVLIILATLACFLLVSALSVFAINKFRSWDYYLAARNFFTDQAASLAQTDDRTNILILGKGGMGHTAPDLTDTIIVVSIPDNSTRATLISIPRDLWIDRLETKVNTLYEKGNVVGFGGGLVLAKSTLEEILGKPIHYGVVFDFGNFKNLIDAVEGVDIDVETAFTDKLYPLEGKEEDLCDGDIEFKCRYETLNFEKGLTHMDGATALKFARSRFAEGDEGTDIARQKRQQKMIGALKEKLSDPKLYLNLKRDLVLFRIVRSSLESDLTIPEMGSLARLLIKSNGFTNYVIPETVIFHPTNPPLFNRIYVFIPRHGLPTKINDWSEIQKWFDSVVKN